MIAINEIHLWISFPDQIQEKKLLNTYQQLMSADERRKYQRFYFARHRHQYLITRALIRTTLSRYAPVLPTAWRFTKNRYGKPEISNDMNLAIPLRFNISHTDGIIICAVVLQQDIGIDIENISRRPINLNIATRFFSTIESEALHALEKSKQCHRFFEYWVLKEAYIKAKGMGLSLPLKQFSYHFLNKKILKISFHSPLKDNPHHWQLMLLQLTKQYKVAIVVQRNKTHIPHHLIVKKIIPLQTESPFQYDLIR